MKITEKRILTFVCLLGLVIHGSGLYFFQKLPLPVSQFSLNKIGADCLFSEKKPVTWVLEVTPEQALSSIEHPLRLSELKPEFAPSFSLSSQKAVSLNPTDFGMTQEFGLSKVEKAEIIDVQMEKESCFLNETASSFELLDETPLLPEINFEDQSSLSDMVAEGDHFNVSVEYTPRRFFPGFIFKVTLIPKQEIAFKRIRENYFFLIDRSNSILRGRFYYNKKAVLEAITHLNPDDTFNILLFDDHVVRLASKPIAPTEENIQASQKFLESQTHGGCFAATNLYHSLGKIIPQDVLDTEINTAILLSDGDTYLSLDKQRQLIGGWSSKNKGKVSLFCLASGEGNNLPLLEIIAKFNKGNLIYVPKHEHVIDKLKDLILTLKHPIGKHIVATAIMAEKDISIYLQPKKERLSDLYKDKGFTIYGSTNKLSDFTLFLQGKYYERRFDIKKKISFSQALCGTVSLEKEWAETVAQEYYEKFFEDGKMKHLEAAKQLLSPLNLSVPFL